MKIEKLNIKEILLITPKKFGDHRGFFSETYNLQNLVDNGISETFVQDNHSLSRDAGVLRGLHYQLPPKAQDKLVRVTRGSIFDVAVDIRKGSATFGQHASAILSAENWAQLWVPKGFAHGFITLEPDTEVQYKVTDFYSPEYDRGVQWNDPDLGINWPVADGQPTLSDKDQTHPRLSELPEIDFST